MNKIVNNYLTHFKTLALQDFTWGGGRKPL